MTNDFEQPTAEDIPTRGRGSAPWQKSVDYKSGKTPEAFAESATPEQVKAGFSYYDKEQGSKFALNDFTASIVAITFGVSGTIPEGKFYTNYLSNLVFDTRTQPIEVFHFMKQGDEWKKNVIASGFYSDFKKDLPTGVGYCKVLVCWIHETQELISMQVSSQFETAIVEGIANATGKSTSKISIFGVAESSERFWTFKFNGQFSKRTKDGKAWNVGDMFFCPSLSCGVMSAERFPVLSEKRQEVIEYVNAQEDSVWKAAGSKKPEPVPLPHPDSVLQPKNCDPFPDQDLTSYDER